MSKIGIATFSSPGHINPSITLATELARRGHQVTFYTLVNGLEKIEASGFRSRPYGLDEFGPESIAESYRELGELVGLQAVRFTVDMMKRRAVAGLRDLPLYFREDKIDGLVVDQVVPAGAVVARAENIPFVTLSNALPTNTDTIAPPVFCSRGPARGPFGRLGIRLLNCLQIRLSKPILDVVNQFQQDRRLPKYTAISEVRSDLAQVAQLPAQFDFRRRLLDDTFHYTGPFHSRESRPSVDFPWERVSEEFPLIYASMGTLQNRIHQVFEMIAEACHGLPIQLVVSLGGSVCADKYSHLVGEPITVAYAPQLDLLRKASVCITHAGLNTALESLAQGVPMLAIPVTNDQPGVAARIQYHELGHVIGLRKVTAQKIRTGLEELLRKPHYALNAKAFEAAIGAIDGTKTAAQIIEKAISSGMPVRRNQ